MVAAFAVAGVGLAVAVWLPGRNDVASASESPTAFVDEFTGSQGTPVDHEKWSLQGRYHDRGTALDGDGHLVVSRLLVSKVAFDQPYGHAEARIQVRRAAGPWRAFTVLDPAGRILAGKFDALDTGVDPTSGDDFHTYAVDWSPESIVWSIDGRPSLRLIPDVAARPLFVFLNLATDGRAPVRMLVDFVRVSTGGAPTTAPTQTPTATPSTSAAPAPTPTAVKPTPTTVKPTPTTVKPTPTTVKPTTAKPKPTKAVAPAWKTFTKYAAGALVSYKGVTYKVKEAHTSLPGWEPTALPELFEKV
jgi:hypothetical protein